jgi:hypothetical protein
MTLRLVTPALLLATALGCNGISTNPGHSLDAPAGNDAVADAMDGPITLQDKEGGVNTALVFTSPNFGGGVLPVVTCQFDGEAATITVTHGFVDIVRGYGAGHLMRQVFTHHPIELTDGSPHAPGDRRRLDMIASWSYDTTWTAQ